jgi:hypothetical protein
MVVVGVPRLGVALCILGAPCLLPVYALPAAPFSVLLDESASRAAAYMTRRGPYLVFPQPGIFVALFLTPTLHCYQVRNRAADNLGALTVLSARVDQLVQDLATQGRMAEPQASCALMCRHSCAA